MTYSSEIVEGYDPFTIAGSRSAIVEGSDPFNMAGRAGGRDTYLKRSSKAYHRTPTRSMCPEHFLKLLNIILHDVDMAKYVID